jgi:hypothetical protein
MKIVGWSAPLTIAAQLAIAAAPHPYGVPHKNAPALFAPRAAMPQVKAEPAPKVLCGMVMVPANPKIDPRMITEPRRDITFAIRAYPRPACRDRD